MTTGSKRMVSVAAALLLQAAAASAAAPEPGWTWAGWGGGGFFWSAVFDPANADTIYLGGDVAGIYKSEDRGRHWRFVNSGLHDYGVHSLTISKSNPRVLYAMTANGMARTSDGGAHWEPLPATFNKTGLGLSIHRPGSVRAMAVHPARPDTVYAGGRSGLLALSRDGGQTWTNLDYRSALDKETRPAPPPPAFEGTGCLWMAYASTPGNAAHFGRVEKFLSQTGDTWSAYGRLTAAFRLPNNAPPLTGHLVVQTGGGWLWQESKAFPGRPEEWTQVEFDLSAVKDLDKVHIVYFVVRSGGRAFSGEIGLDAVTLHPVDPAGEPRRLGAWEKPGSTDGWKAGSHSKDSPHITAIRPSSEPAVPADAPIASVVISEADSSVVLVAHRTLGLFRSADGGATWTRTWSRGGAASIAVFPGDGRTAYAAFGTNGVWKSRDGGLTWLPAGLNGSQIREVAVDPRNPDKAHAIGSADWKGRYYRTRDGGATWQSVGAFTRDLVANPTSPEEAAGRELPAGQVGLSTPSNLALSPSEPDTLFIAANWCNILSTDGGATWEERTRGADISCVYDIRFLDGRTYAVAMDEGLLASDDNGARWQQLTPRRWMPGVSGHQWQVLAWKDGGKEKILSTVSPWRGAEEYPNAVMLSEDGGATFAKVTNGLPATLPKVNCMWGEGYARTLAADPADPNVIYLGIDGDPEPAKGRAGGGVFKSVDSGKSWRQLANQPASRRMFFGLAIDPSRPGRLYWGACGAGGGVHRSDDGGETWQRTSLPDAWVFNVEVSPSGTVYAGAANLWRSTDQGRTWKQLTAFKTGTVIGIEIDPGNEKRVWISTTTWDGSSRGGVYRTEDGGAAWTEITGDLPYRKPMVLRYNPATKELWAGGVGLFRISQ